MVSRLLRDGDQIAVVVGRAGTGKTYALDAARAAWQTEDHQVIGAALARRAALELRDGSGIDSTSIHALLGDLRERPDHLLGPKTVLVIDEAGMVGTRQLAEIVEHIQRAQAKLVLVGDPGQLPEIDAGGSFRALTIRGNPISLSDNRRQREEWERDALELLRSGRSGEALAAYHEHGRIVLADTATGQRERIVEDWWTARHNGQDTVMIAPRRADVAELNQRARARMTAHGRFGAQALAVHGQPFAVGDEVVCLRNHPALGVTNGTRGTIAAIDLEHRELTLTDPTGNPITLTAAYLQSTTQRGGPTLDYAYAITGHKAQGATVDQALVLGSDALYREWGYVAMSRARHTNRLYLVAGEPELEDPLRRDDVRHPVDRAVRTLARSKRQISATDASTHSSIAAMSLPQLRDRVRELDREAQADQRRARRQRALQGRDARSGKQPSPGLPEPPDSRDEERALLRAEVERRTQEHSLGLMLDPPRYLTHELGPVPDELVARRRWRAAAREIATLRDQIGCSNHNRALPKMIRDPDTRARAEALRRDIAESRGMHLLPPSRDITR